MLYTTHKYVNCQYHLPSAIFYSFHNAMTKKSLTVIVIMFIVKVKKPCTMLLQYTRTPHTVDKKKCDTRSTNDACIVCTVVYKNAPVH